MAPDPKSNVLLTCHEQREVLSHGDLHPPQLYKGGEVCEARLTCHLEIVYLHCTVGGDVDLHDVEPLVARDELEGHQVRGQGPYDLDLKSIVVLPPDEAYSSLVWAGHFQNKYSISQEGL